MVAGRVEVGATHRQALQARHHPQARPQAAQAALEALEVLLDRQEELNPGAAVALVAVVVRAVRVGPQGD